MRRQSATKKKRGGNEVVPLPIDRRGGDSIRKRMTYTTTVSTSAGTSLAIAATGAQVQSLPANEWASFSNRYISYRVRAITVYWAPFYPVNLAALAHDVFAVVEDPSGITSAGGTYNSLISLKRLAMHPTFRPWKFKAKASEEDHLLWSPTSGPIPSGNYFQVKATSGGALTTATIYGRYTVIWDVELRGSQ